jgi:hypothetical protein
MLRTTDPQIRRCLTHCRQIQKTTTHLRILPEKHASATKTNKTRAEGYYQVVIIFSNKT